MPKLKLRKITQMILTFSINEIDTKLFVRIISDDKQNQIVTKSYAAYKNVKVSSFNKNQNFIDEIRFLS